MNAEERKISKEQSRLFLQQYMNAYSPVGAEFEGQTIWANYLKQYVDKLDQDNYGTVYGIVRSKDQDNKKESQRYKVVIEAHCDEIAWQVTSIEGGGIIHVTKCGGSDAAIAPSKKVIIHTKDGRRIPGVFGFPAIHVRKTLEEKAPKPENLTIDVGYNTKQSVIEKL